LTPFANEEQNTEISTNAIAAEVDNNNELPIDAIQAEVDNEEINGDPNIELYEGCMQDSIVSEIEGNENINPKELSPPKDEDNKILNEEDTLYYGRVKVESGYTIPMKINGVLTHALIDTGADVTVISKNIVEAMTPPVQITKSRIRRIIGVGNHIVKVLGEIETVIQMIRSGQWICWSPQPTNL
jgi:predicted aspartyl protease